MIIHGLERLWRQLAVLISYAVGQRLRCLDSFLCRPVTLTGEVTLQSVTDGQSNLLLLTLTQDMTEATMPIATNMLSLAVSALMHTLKNHTHSETLRKIHTHTPDAAHAHHTYSFSSLAMMTGSSVPSSECHCKHADGKTEGGETP